VCPEGPMIPDLGLASRHRRLGKWSSG
jgi:hypothetical protein